MTDRALVATDRADLAKPDIQDAFAAFLRLNVAQACPVPKRG